MLIEFAYGGNPNTEMMHVGSSYEEFMIEHELGLIFFHGSYFDVGDDWVKIITEVDIEKIVTHPESEWTPDALKEVCEGIMEISDRDSENSDFAQSEYCFDDVRDFEDKAPTAYIKVGNNTIPIIESEEV
jgi:hypothetical protein